MSKTHYEILGIAKTATATEIKSAYRKIVLQHHPDRSKDPASPGIFMRATEAYDLLSDEAQRQAYDESLELQRKRAAERDRENIARAARARAQTTTAWRAPTPPALTRIPSADLQRLTVLFSRGRHAEAETLARQLSHIDSRHPVPYAVLGDIARLRGHLDEAARMYAYAAQFDPNNPVYQRRYEEILNSSRLVEDRHLRTRLQPEDRKILGPIAGGIVVVFSAIYVATALEAPILPMIPPINTLSGGLLVMEFLSGVAVGASLAMGNLLDRFQSVSVGSNRTIGPNLALGLVAIINFWAAGVLYLALGAVQRAFNFSTTRLLAGVMVAAGLLTVGSMANPMLNAGQVLVWGANLIYTGALVGWMVADAFRA